MTGVIQKLKLQENLDSEIMEVLLQEARESYDEEISRRAHKQQLR